jgi:hypothetical protein
MKNLSREIEESLIGMENGEELGKLMREFMDCSEDEEEGLLLKIREFLDSEE